MSFKMVALDIDGTIRQTGGEISRRTRDAVDKVQEKGAIVTLATGRMFRSASASSMELGLTFPIVTSQGAHIAFPLNGEVLWHKTLTKEMLHEALVGLEGRNLQVIGYCDDGLYVNKSDDWALDYAQRNGMRLEVVDDMRQVNGVEFTRLVAVGADELIETTENDLQSIFRSNLTVTRSLSYFCEILHPDCGKEKALAVLGDRLNIGPGEIIAFGNGYNDVEMLRWSGWGVAIDGSVKEVIDVADQIIPSIEMDGVAQTLECLLEKDMIG